MIKAEIPFIREIVGAKNKWQGEMQLPITATGELKTFQLQVQRYAPEIEKRLRQYWRNPADFRPWHIDDAYVKVNGRQANLYRVVGLRGHTIDLHLSTRRNTKAAYRFIGKILNKVKQWKILRLINMYKHPYMDVFYHC